MSDFTKYEIFIKICDFFHHEHPLLSGILLGAQHCYSENQYGILGLFINYKSQLLNQTIFMIGCGYIKLTIIEITYTQHFCNIISEISIKPVHKFIKIITRLWCGGTQGCSIWGEWGVGAITTRSWEINCARLDLLCISLP